MTLYSFMNNYKQFKIFFKTCVRAYSIPKPKQPGTAIALDHFDQYYSTVYKNWPSIRLGLLCPHNYCAVVNAFSKVQSSTELFGGLDVFNMKDAYYLSLGKTDSPDSESNAESIKEEKNDEANDIPPSDTQADTSTDSEMNCLVEQGEYMPATQYMNRDFEMEEDYLEFFNPQIEYEAEIVKHGTIYYPENWKVYFGHRGKFKMFPPPKTDVTGLLNYYLMDGASILPVFALDVQKNEEVGDLCASPGGKTLSIIFGLQFGKIVCNDISVSRLNKLKTVLNSYLPKTEDWSKRILISNLNVSNWSHFEAFDKILLDVPCTNDRLSVTKDGNNIFQPKRFNERMQMPKLQTSMLCAALKALKPGGSLVYSTCSLSPLQNDGVVHIALSMLSTECPHEFVINDLSTAFAPLKKIFQFSDVCKYGQLVVPFLPLNYGPMYIAKITRNK